MAIGVLIGVLCIVAANALARKLQVAAPIALVLTGVLASLQPVFECPRITIAPELILQGVLPLLLFAAAVSMPATSFRRNFGPIAGLSVTLVVATSLSLGWLFSRLVPGLGFAGGVALGAVISPTDAVATTIVKRIGVAPRVVAVLDGEAMLNDASALVIVRTALAAMGAASTRVGPAIGKFFLSILIASVIGFAVGWISLQIRRRVEHVTTNTLFSFVVPFLAFQPAEHAGASGLVAVVAAGLVIGHAAPRYLAPHLRVNETINWRTIEMLLEGGLFLLMGLQLVALLDAARADLGFAIGLAAAALGVTLATRVLYVPLILRSVRHHRDRFEKNRTRAEDMRVNLVAKAETDAKAKSRLARFQTRLNRFLADADYESTSQLGARDAILLIWAGMRGAITLAAAETLPEDFPHRSLLVLVAFIVATSSIVIQGSTVGWLVRKLKFPPRDEVAFAKERDAILKELLAAAHTVLHDGDVRMKYGDEMVDRLEARLADTKDLEKFSDISTLVDDVFEAQRRRILDVRNEGAYSAELLTSVLNRVDAMQLGMSLTRRGRVGDDD
ncbi:MAG: cation:proton antiporter [Kofleriaceae bacterium]